MSGPGTVAALAARCVDLDGGDDAGFLARWDAVWAWATSPEAAPALLTALDGPEGAALEGVLARFQRRALAIRERRTTDALLARLGPGGGAVRAALTDPFGVATYDRVVEVARLLDLAACARAVVVGGGPFPAAALFLRDATSIPAIDVLDVDPEAALRVGRWAAWCADGRIRPRRADGTVADFAGASLVYVVNQVTPKAAVVRRVRDTAPADVSIVVREPEGLGRLVAERALVRPIEGLTVVGRGATDPTFRSGHVVLARAR